MESQFNFYAEKIINGQCYPALAQYSAEPYTPEWRTFIQHYPYTTPNKLIDYCAEHNFKYNINKTTPAYYIITLGFFDFTIDYFSLIARNHFFFFSNLWSACQISSKSFILYLLFSPSKGSRRNI